MKLPGPFDIQRVVESVWPGQPVDYLFDGVTPARFAETRTSRDARFVNVAAGTLLMSFHSLVVRTDQGVLLVDSCVGNHKDRELVPEWHRKEFPYLERLAQAGLTPADIDFVCCTHLHGDHVGWNTQLDNGRWVPTFANARYLFAEAEIAFWERLNTEEPGNMYNRVWADSLLPVLEAGLVDRVAGDHEILPGINLLSAPGHTPGNVVIELDDGRSRAMMSGDVIHHPVQIECPDWCAVFDWDQAAARISRERILRRLADTGTVLMGAHFTGPSALLVESEAEGFFYHDVV
jgi:glyoxylase-like metal-dependent hydrolase (beta-lactamase superfamily II)